MSSRVISPEAMAALQGYDWPGNVRQLRNAVDWILIMVPGSLEEPVGVENLPPDVGTGTAASVGFEGGAKMMSLPLREARENFERQYLLAQVSRFGGNVSRTAEFIGMEHCITQKAQDVGLQIGRSRTGPAEGCPIWWDVKNESHVCGAGRVGYNIAASYRWKSTM